jgi:lipoprotein-releasing system permease protein
MYKLLLCGRYLRTRYIALASIVSVTLGVATMIVVNSVMQGFTGEMQNRIHAILSDLTFQSNSADGMPDFDNLEQQIRNVAGDEIEAMSPTVFVSGMLYFQHRGREIVRQVEIIGIDPKTQSSVSGFGDYLQHPANRESMSFDLREGGYDVLDHQSGPDASDVPERKQMGEAGWGHRREQARIKVFQNKFLKENKVETAPSPGSPSADPFANHAAEENRFDPAKQQHSGTVLGIAMTSYRTPEGEDRFLAVPGDDVKLAFYSFRYNQPPKVECDNFTIVDYYESKMSEYDSKFVFVPIEKLQELRGMHDPTSGVRSINTIQIKLKPGADGEAVRNKLRKAFPPELYGVYTWQDKQEVLLAAVHLETMVLNILLFLIIAVAGFGILAIFYMIVVEKTRDIGILKSLGASGRGVMGIFLGYGLSLGLVGSGVGMLFGLLIVRNINQIANWISWITGKPVFDPSVYYFYKIPTVVFPETVAWIVGGALLIAVAASVLPALRAAKLHPVEALRYE